MNIAQLTIDDIKSMDQNALDKMFCESKAGPIPDGDSKGTKLIFPDTQAYESAKQQEESGIIWEGKIFFCPDPQGPGTLKNKVNGMQVFEAQVFYGTSSLDGEKCIILDYSNAPEYENMRVRDELRCVSEGLYLGRMVRVDEQGNSADFILNFCLEF